MDRNEIVGRITIKHKKVATREGGVDRNMAHVSMELRELTVATREGGVDRNDWHLAPLVDAVLSPPARVAWIETSGPRRPSSVR